MKITKEQEKFIKDTFEDYGLQFQSDVIPFMKRAFEHANAGIKKGAEEFYARGKADAWKEAVEFLHSQYEQIDCHNTRHLFSEFQISLLRDEGKKRGYLK